MIVDRTAKDVARWRELHDKGWENMTAAERSEWTGEMKGRYTAADMNRVEGAVASISARLIDMGYLTTPLSVKTNWDVWGVPTKADMTRYLGNIATLRNAVEVYPTTPVAPTINQNFNYETANDIERILLDVEKIITAIPSAWIYAGDIKSGEA